jgi:hypothetical protein
MMFSKVGVVFQPAGLTKLLSFPFRCTNIPQIVFTRRVPHADNELEENISLHGFALQI